MSLAEPSVVRGRQDVWMSVMSLEVLLVERIVANSTTCWPIVRSCSAAAASEVEPSSANRLSAALMVAPSGVGQPRSAWVICRNCCSVETVACHP